MMAAWPGTTGGKVRAARSAGTAPAGRTRIAGGQVGIPDRPPGTGRISK
jgi:hypothetical protein